MEFIDGELDSELGRSRRVIPQPAPQAAPSKLEQLGIRNEDMLGIRAWVTAKDDEQYSQLPADVVEVSVTHSNLQQKMLALRFNLHMTIGDLKARLYLHHGTPACSQRLVLKDGGSMLCALDDDSKMLGFYSVQSGQTIHVVDTDPHSISRGGGLENVDLVDKYRMSDEAYDQRKGTLREWIREQKQNDPTWKMQQPAAAQQPTAPQDASHIRVGDRCLVEPGERRGQVAYVGAAPGLEGVWVGVKLDEPLGKHDGLVKGTRLFDALPKHGALVRPNNVQVGDFPELDLLDDDEL